MKRFDITEWCDLVRGVTDPETEERMRLHLAADPAARTAAAAMQWVADVARSDHEGPVPEHALRFAKAIGSLQRPPAATRARRRSLLQPLRFEIAFDSLLAGAGAGTRDLQAGHRQLAFEADDYSIEVRLEHEIEPPGTVVVGQILSRGEAGAAGRVVAGQSGAARPVAEAPILVLAGGRIVGQATSGRFGEFQVEGLPPRSLKLCLLPARGQLLELPLVEAPQPPIEEQDS